MVKNNAIKAGFFPQRFTSATNDFDEERLGVEVKAGKAAGAR
ncbi:hypothetical protein CEV33_0531 [Brucella grignonensis]|uniref:Uncharacterized protein n=1 Tax=Brucella grignonensis TaxID=94627 RepID=A0A256FFZ2_9HYPH|nr:hypothetical protein CEV33_0531 [Brucella grignonensis]